MRIQRIRNLLCFLLVTAFQLVGSIEDFEVLKGGTLTDYAQSILPTSDGYFIAGCSLSKGNGVYAIWVFKMDLTGTNILWEKVLACTSSNFVYSMAHSSSGGFILGGYRYPDCNTEAFYTTYLVQFSSAGDIEWEKDYNDYDSSQPYAILTLASGGYLVFGETTVRTFGLKDGYAMQISSTGNYNWYKNYGNIKDDVFYSATELSDGSFLAVGSTDPAGTGMRECWMVKMDSSGNTLLNKKYGGPDDDYCNGATQLSDGKYGLIGSTKSKGNGDYDLWYLKIDTDGTVLKDVTFGGSYKDEGIKIIKGTDSKLYIGGYTSSFGQGNEDIWLLRIDDSGNKDWEKTLGGANQDKLKDMVLHPDNSIVIVGESSSGSAGSYDYYISVLVFSCDSGRYMNVDTQRCVKCPAGTYNPNSGATSSTACTKCSKGTYQTLEGQSECTQCPTNTYNPNEGSTASTSCLDCSNGWLTTEAQDQCLYKGVYTTIEEFDATQFRSNCFDSNRDIVKPFTKACREAYRPICCVGSAKKTNVPCNFALELSDSDSLYDRYCSACTFTDQTKCPPNGLCWDDTLYTSNDQNPYIEPYGEDCLESIGAYCTPRLMQDRSDLECSLFSNYCGTTLQSATYGSKTDAFELTFTYPVWGTLPECKSMFDLSETPASGTLTCEKTANNVVKVDVTELQWPMINFKLAAAGIKDACGVYVPVSDITQIVLPSPVPESVEISGEILDKCIDLKVTSNIVKSYNTWPIKDITWTVSYTTDNVPSETATRLSQIGPNQNLTEVTVAEYDLIPGKTLTFRATILTAFGTIIYSNILSLLVPPITFGRKYCGPCQFNNRSMCSALDGICWSNHLNYAVVAPDLSQNCINEIATPCYKIWQEYTLADLQCIHFVDSLDFAQMALKPNVTNATYSADGTILSINFSLPIDQSDVLSLAQVLEPESLEMLPAAKSFRWFLPTQLHIDYEPYRGILKEIKTRGFSLHYPYEYSQEKVDPALIEVEIPASDIVVRIKTSQAPNECENLELSAVVERGALYPLEYSWNIQIKERGEWMTVEREQDLLEYLKPFLTYSPAYVTIVIPSEYLFKGTVLSATLRAKFASDYQATKTVETVVTIKEFIGKARFLSSAHVAYIDAANPRTLPVHLSTEKCKRDGLRRLFEGWRPNLITTRFTAYSKSNGGKDWVRTEKEVALEQNLNKQLTDNKEIRISAEHGFEYSRLYNLTLISDEVGTNRTTSDSQMVYLVKPPIRAIIEGSNVVQISHDIRMNGQNSYIPESSGDHTKYSWNCVSAVSYNLATVCACPVMKEVKVNKMDLLVPKEEFQELCHYTFSFAISSEFRGHKRSAYNLTDFVTVSKIIPEISVKSFKGLNDNVNDHYFTVVLDESLNSSSITSYNWSLIEVGSEQTPLYSKKAAFIAWALQSMGYVVDRTPAKNDVKEIPSNLKFITPTDRRVLGIDLDSIKNEYNYYTFAIVVTYSNFPPVFALTTLTNPYSTQLIQRSFNVTPTFGYGFGTPFTFTFSPTISTAIDRAHYQLFRHDCTNPSPMPITKPLSTLNAYYTKLASGSPACNYTVTFTLRTTEGEISSEISRNVTVLPLWGSVDRIIMQQIEAMGAVNMSLDAKQTLVSEMANTELKEFTEDGERIAGFLVSTILREELYNAKEDIGAIRSSLEILTQTLKNHKINIKERHTGEIHEKVKEYINGAGIIADKNKLIPSLYTLLAELADTSIDNKQYVSEIMKTEREVGRMLIKSIQPEGPTKVLHTNLFELIEMKSYLDNLHAERTMTTEGGIVMQLPKGNAVISPEHDNVLFTMAILAMKKVPDMDIHGLIKLNLTSYENSTNLVSSEEATKFYTKLVNGKLSDKIGTAIKHTEVIQISLIPSKMLWNTTEVFIDSKISFENDSTVEISWPFNLSTLSNNSIALPLWYNEETKLWTNEGANLLFLNGSQSMLKAIYNKTASAYTVHIVENYQLPSVEVVSSTDLSLPIFTSIIAFFCVLLLLEITLYFSDKSTFFDLAIKVLEDRYRPTPLPKIAPSHGLLYSIYTFMQQVYQVGMLKASLKHQQQIVPASTTLGLCDTRLDSPQGDIGMLPNGYSKLALEEEKTLKYHHMDYMESKEWLGPKEVKDSMYEDLAEDKVLIRLAKASTDVETEKRDFTLCTIFKIDHLLVSAIGWQDGKTPSALKLLVLIVALLGELFVTSYLSFSYFDSEPYTEDWTEFVIKVVIYAAIACGVMVPFKILIYGFIQGLALNTKMQREEIELRERREKIYRVFGVIIAFICIVGACIGTVIFAEELTEMETEKWALTFAGAIVCELIVVVVLKIILKILLGMILLRLARSKVINTKCGSCICTFIDAMVCLCSFG